MLLGVVVFGDKGNYVLELILKVIGNWESSLINRCFFCFFKENYIYLCSFFYII